MRVLVAIAMLMMVGTAYADDKSATADANKKAAAKAKALKPYAGKLVISPDAPPTIGDELPAYLDGNLSKDGNYELIKGPPWPFHVALVLATPQKAVTLIVTDKADPKAAPLLTAPISPAGDRKLVLAKAEGTIAAGFAANKPYVVRVVVGKKVLAKAELLLRD
jgi:hypothetical protein